MKNQTNNLFLLIGLPSTGKTSFLAALWYMVGQSRVECELSLDHLEGDSQYLNLIRDAWSEYRPVPRNTAHTEKHVAMWLKNPKTGTVGRLTFPDLSGEAFRSQWTQRQVPTAYDKELAEAAGGVLFVNPVGPEKIIKPIRIDNINAVLEGIGGEDVKKTKIKSTPWDIERSPTQVQLVDILQFMAGRSHFHAPFRLAVVVSAWDLVRPANRQPSKWVATELPLLKQYLDSNGELFETSFYGVSAQGGRYALPHFFAGNFKNAQPFAKRIFDRQDAISSWIWEKLEPTSKTTLESVQAGNNITALQRNDLARDFNRIMAEGNIYEEVRFSEVDLRPETDSMLRESVEQVVEQRLELGRFLLEDAYPDLLSRERENQEEATELQKKSPPSRVIVVEDDAETSNDVTKPIQWLMH
jgi:hypothetical protein